jgi:hypothetical protein
MRVQRLNAPQFGAEVLYLQEFRATQPGLAHRQRVTALVWDKERGQVRAQQFFFKTGAAYNRQPLAAEVVAKMPRESFDHIERCDLFFEWEEKNARYRGAMLPRVCEYVHPVDGKVYAEFDMLLWDKHLWYRDRSLKVAGGGIRGEIDGFSWLRFEKETPLAREEFARRFPALARQGGVWEGRFRRYDADGKLTADFASQITVSFDFSDAKSPYRQTNRYTFADGKTQTIEAVGRIEGGKLIFANEQIEGWAADPLDDPNRRTTLIYFRYKDGSDIYIYEIVTLSEDGQRRSRATQYLKEGRIIRRTFIDEVKIK